MGEAMTRFRSILVRLACVLAIVLPLSAIGVTSAYATTFTTLTLSNGWHNASGGTRPGQVANVSGIVTLKGAIATAGTSPVAFTLPSAYRPSTAVYVPVGLCNATKGRLFIAHNGVVTVQAAGGVFANAQCLPSLEGASFAVDATSFTALTLTNGWTNAPFSTRNAAARKIGGVVHLQGAIATSGVNPTALTLPSALRPSTDVYVPVDMCGAANGRLLVYHDGRIDVDPEGTFGDAQCFTSLEGVSFALDTTSFTVLPLKNGWVNDFSIRKAGVRTIGGIVHFEGAVNSGTSATLFTLPAAFRPSANVYVPVDLCNADNGRLLIKPSGVVTVQAESGTFSNAQCLTSLESAFFAL